MRTWDTVLVHAVAVAIGAWGVSATAHAVDAPLSPGNPVVAGAPTTFSGVGGTNTSGGAVTAQSAFEAAIGGVRNSAASPQTGGFRTITWDGVKLDGTDFGGETVVIVPDKTIGIPVNRFEGQGVVFEEIYAVADDGFLAVNPNVAGRFPAFSPLNTFAMFNDNSIGFRFALAASPTVTPEPATTRGFGAVFRNVQTPNTTSIEYFHGAASLGKFFAPTGTQGQAEFLGVLFANPVVTSITITCGTDTLFSFDGTAIVSGGADSPPTHNLVVTDDFVYPEPTAPTNAIVPVAATAGAPFSGVVAVFSDADPGGTAKNFTAVIDWGDGGQSSGTIAANAGGGFDVSGSHTYADPGTFDLGVDVADLEGAALTVANTATVAAAATTTTTIPCAGDDLPAVACLLREVPPPPCAGLTLPARITKLAAAARSLADRARAAEGKRQKKIAAKLVKVLGRAVGAVGQVPHLAGGCPAALASLFADARGRAQEVVATL
jgi:hypothetical protein